MRKVRVLIVLLLAIFTVNVYAVSSNASVGVMTEYNCSAFQDNSMNITGDAYFGRCMESKCNGSKWTLKYYSANSVTCANGNLNPYTKISKTGCGNYQNTSCNNNGAIQYCTTITYYDCNRTSNGSQFTTTAKKTNPKTNATQPTTESTTTTVTTVITEAPKNNNTYLSNITLSTGTITFNKDVKEYSIEVGSNISFITVNATPEVATSKVSVSGNSNLVAGDNKITITVVAEDGSKGIYAINVKKESSLSNNTKLSSITIDGKALNKFNSSTYAYTYETKKSSIEVIATPEDSEATYSVTGADNIKKGSMVKVAVTAADGKTVGEYTITITSPSSTAGIITIVFIVILVVVIGAGAFYFYTKKKNGGDKEYEYE